MLIVCPAAQILDFYDCINASSSNTNSNSNYIFQVYFQNP